MLCLCELLYALDTAAGIPELSAQRSSLPLPLDVYD